MSSAKKYPKSSRRRDALRLVARQYAGANLKKPKGWYKITSIYLVIKSPCASKCFCLPISEYWDDTLNIVWGNQDVYEVSRQLGKGKYGEVYESINQSDKSHCVIKIMRPVKEHRLRREIKILQHVKGGPNIVGLIEVVRDPDTKTPCFVFEFVDAIGFRELQASVTDLDVRHYLFQVGYDVFAHAH